MFLGILMELRHGLSSDRQHFWGFRDQMSLKHNIFVLNSCFVIHFFFKNESQNIHFFKKIKLREAVEFVWKFKDLFLNFYFSWKIVMFCGLRLNDSKLLKLQFYFKL